MIQREQEKIKKILKYEPAGKPISDLRSHYFEIEETEFSKESLAPFLIDWYNHIEKVHYLIREDEFGEEIEEHEEQKEELQKDISQLRKEKQILEASEDEQLLSEKEEFLEEFGKKIHIDSCDLTDKQKS